MRAASYQRCQPRLIIINSMDAVVNRLRMHSSRNYKCCFPAASLGCFAGELLAFICWVFLFFLLSPITHWPKDAFLCTGREFGENCGFGGSSARLNRTSSLQQVAKNCWFAGLLLFIPGFLKPRAAECDSWAATCLLCGVFPAPGLVQQ